ncbi:MAG: hypothetical protein ACLQF1_01855 [Methyloceanibacter sp.]
MPAPRLSGRSAPLLRRDFSCCPRASRDFVDGLGEAQGEGMSFEEAREWLEGTEAEDAFRAWNAAVAALVMGYTPLLPKRR